MGFVFPGMNFFVSILEGGKKVQAHA